MDHLHCVVHIKKCVILHPDNDGCKKWEEKLVNLIKID